MSTLKKILLVEDNPMLQEILLERLHRHGFVVTAVDNGAEAIRQAGALQPDLILMDMRLPVLDGWEASRRLKQAPATRQIPIIALTAHALIGDHQSSILAGCDDYETKPVDFQKLLQKIKTLTE